MDTATEVEGVAAWLALRGKEGLAPHEIGAFVRSQNELDRAREAMRKAGLPFKVLDERVQTVSGYASIGTMHLAKGLEFRAVVVMACDDQIIPSQSRIESVADSSDLDEVYTTERHLLYVACTRARDHHIWFDPRPERRRRDHPCLRSTPLSVSPWPSRRSPEHTPLHRAFGCAGRRGRGRDARTRRQAMRNRGDARKGEACPIVHVTLLRAVNAQLDWLLPDTVRLQVQDVE